MGDPETVIYYKIRNKSRPEWYHKGGIYNQWTKTGKVWPTLGQLRSMITMNMAESSGAAEMANWEIVEYEIKEVAVKSVHEVVSAKKLVELLKK